MIISVQVSFFFSKHLNLFFSMLFSAASILVENEKESKRDRAELINPKANSSVSRALCVRSVSS